MGRASALFFMTKDNWRNEPGLVATNEYKRNFAYLPVSCTGGEKIWFSYYYKHLQHWTVGRQVSIEDQYYYHTDFVGNITEQEYVVRKLSETL